MVSAGSLRDISTTKNAITIDRLHKIIVIIKMNTTILMVAATRATSPIQTIYQLLEPTILLRTHETLSRPPITTLGLEVLEMEMQFRQMNL